MPELPEVEVVRQGLASAVTGASVLGVDVLDERVLRRHPAGAADFVGRLEGAVFAAPQRRGKFLWLPLAVPGPITSGGDPALDGEHRPEPADSWPTARSAAPPEAALLAHLGMSGQLLLRTPDAADDRHLRIRLRLDGPRGRYDVVFVDQRTFGSLAVDRLVSPLDADDTATATEPRPGAVAPDPSVASGRVGPELSQALRLPAAAGEADGGTSHDQLDRFAVRRIPAAHAEAEGPHPADGGRRQWSGHRDAEPLEGSSRIGAGRRERPGSAAPPAEPRATAQPERIPAQVLHIARDPLDPRFDDESFLRRLRLRRSPVKAALLDQGLVSGIGNIYADEALWRVRIHHARPADSLTARSARALLTQVREVFAQALAEGGTSFDAQYVNVNGQAGYFAHSLNAYGRTGRPCPRCGTLLVRERFQNRHSHFCPRCQRRPRL